MESDRKAREPVSLAELIGPLLYGVLPELGKWHHLRRIGYYDAMRRIKQIEKFYSQFEPWGA